MENKEIEIKLRLTEEEFFRIRNYLQKAGTFIQKKHQTDEYYSPVGESFYDSGDRCLRVRKEDNRVMLSYKQIHGENTDKQYIEEYETLVADAKMMWCILNALLFVREIVIDKRRIEYELGDEFLVALDQVENLGYFIEIENCDEFETLETRNRRLIELIRELGIDLAKRNTEGYSNMMFRMKKEEE